MEVLLIHLLSMGLRFANAIGVIAAGDTLHMGGVASSVLAAPK
jgi:hypothetical protein